MKHKTTILITLVLIASTILFETQMNNTQQEEDNQKTNNENQTQIIGVPIASIAGMPKNAEQAAKYGIKGLIHITSTSNHTAIYVPKGESRNYTLQLRYISFTNQTSTYVNVKPKGPNDVGSGDLWLSDYVIYIPDGIVEVRADRIKKITMIVTAPRGIDLSFPLHSVGITSQYDIFDDAGLGSDG